MSDTEATRVKMSAAASTPPDTLAALAKDPSVQVRAALALNPHIPHAASRTLANDADERVRLLLARRLSALAPSLSGTQQSQLQQEVYATLALLVEDEAVRVRAAIADAVKHVPDAPRDLILRLASDREHSVREPIIQFSPLLTNADLLALLAGAPEIETLRAIAQRPNIDEAVSDAITASSSAVAIHTLLCNSSAQIREATLDAIIGMSRQHVDWHEPLVRRPRLTPAAARALSEIVATHLLQELAARSDIDPSVAQELRQRLADELARARAPNSGQRAANDAHTRVRQLSAGKLDETGLLEAVRRGDTRVASAILATAAGVPVAAVNRAAALRSAKGMVSLAWQAGFSMRAAIAAQALLARIPPKSILVAGPEGTFPLTVDEMRWHIEFLTRRHAAGNAA